MGFNTDAKLSTEGVGKTIISNKSNCYHEILEEKLNHTELSLYHIFSSECPLQI